MACDSFHESGELQIFPCVIIEHIFNFVKSLGVGEGCVLVGRRLSHGRRCAVAMWEVLPPAAGDEDI